MVEDEQVDAADDSLDVDGGVEVHFRGDVGGVPLLLCCGRRLREEMSSSDSWREYDCY